MIDELVRTIVFYTFGLLNSAHTGYMTLFPAVFTLQHSEVHVCAMNCSDEAANVESLSYAKSIHLENTSL